MNANTEKRITEERKNNKFTVITPTFTLSAALNSLICFRVSMGGIILLHYAFRSVPD